MREKEREKEREKKREREMFMYIERDVSYFHDHFFVIAWFVFQFTMRSNILFVLSSCTA